jgi:hypothetical protein
VSIETISSPLPGERVLDLSPGNATEASQTWLRRPNLFPGRALTAASLEQRQRWQVGHIIERASAWVAGIDEGLEVQVALEGNTGPKDVRITVGRGLGLAASGEDVVLQRPLSCRLSDVQIVAPAGFFQNGSGVGDSGEEGTLLDRDVGFTLGDLLKTENAAARAALPALGVLVLQPVTVDTADLDPLDPCDRSAFEEDTADDPTAVEDWRIGDAVRLLWFVWPGEWRHQPAVPAAQLRNAAAWAVFRAEAELPRDEAMPWEGWGVAVAMAALDTTGPLHPLWVDRASVARRGGRARDARLHRVGGGSLLVPEPRLPTRWQSQIEQLAEQVAAAGDLPPAELAQQFARWLPPVGLLPKNCFDPLAQQSRFFPPQFDLDAAPVPVDQLDLAVRASAGLAPLDRLEPESVRLLVPVPLASWEPRLLIRELVDPEFQRTVDRHRLERARALGARQGLRHKAAMLSHALDGRVPVVPDFSADPAATEPEGLKPWGPPPNGGGHRSALMAGFHEHYFDGATRPFPVNRGESVFVWICLDPDNPPRTVMLQWHTAATETGAADWEHRAYWGEDGIPRGGPGGSAAHLRAGDLPPAGQWFKLKVPAAAVGLAGRSVDGMAFSLQDGRAAFGLAGTLNDGGWNKWFCNFLPDGARVQGNEPWDLLSGNDLWVPFDVHDGVVPSLPEVVVQSSDSGGFGDTAASVSTYRAVPTSGFNIRHLARPGWRGHYHRFLDVAHILKIGEANLQPTANPDRLRVWLYLDELTPPSSLVSLTMSRSVDASNRLTGPIRVDLAVWGESRMDELIKVSPEFAVLSPMARLTRGPLPQSGTWNELPLPLTEASAEGATGRVQVLVTVFVAFGGDLAFSDLFIRRGLPLDPPPAPERLWPKSFRGDVTVPPVIPFLNPSVIVQHNLGVLTPTPSARIGTVRAYTEFVKDPAIQALSAHEQSQMLLRGLSGFADYLRRRIDRADDITDFGFAHMQVDLHRIRQLMMSTSDAARLAVSPALAAIAKSDSALVVQGQISEYLGKVRAAGTPTGFAATAAAATATATAAAAAAPAGTANATAAASAGNVATAAGSVSALRTVSAATRFKLVAAPRAPVNIVYSQPVIGLSEVRTAAIADRLKHPPSTEARDYALANRHRTVSSLLELLDVFMTEDRGTAPALLVDFEVYGLAGDLFLGGVNGLKRKLIDFRNTPSLVDSLRVPPALSNGSVDEASLFTQTVALSDNTIAMLRQLETRLIAYREALSRCDTALAGLLDDINGTRQRQAAVDDALAEARHDVSVARALLAEETQRIADINARRTRVLSEEVKFIAYVRPRETDNLLATPSHAVDPALAVAPVPACLREHPDLADELLDMLRVVREAPATWFVKVPPLLQKLDRIEHLQRSLQTAQTRVLSGLSVPGFTALGAGTVGKVALAINRVNIRQAEALAPRAVALQALDLRTLSTATWKAVQVQAQQLLSFGDLADGSHGRSDVAQSAASELHNIRSIVACLHAEFSGVLPALRLAWAETLSEFDAAPNLRNLAGLPRWAEIDSIDRRQMQAYVDWLFDQIEPQQPQAVALVNDVVRMCLLLASHAPVDRIVAGRLARPVTGVSPGVRIPLTVLSAVRLRVGMQAVLYRGDAVVARAVVEDLGLQEVSAHVIHTSAARVDLGDDVRVHFDDAAALSLNGASARRTLFRP